MGKFIQYKIEDYTFIYDNSLNDEFNNLGYKDEDLRHLGHTLLVYLKTSPPKLKGDVIKKSGGAVKVRVSKSSSTRGSEDRLIYTLVFKKYFIFIRLYSKSRKKDLSRKELKEISELVNQYKAFFIPRMSGAALSGAVSISALFDRMSLGDTYFSTLGFPDLEDSFEFVDEIITLD